MTGLDESIVKEERELIRRFNAGQSQALHCIYERHKSALVRVAQALLNDPTGIEDVLHDVFVQFAAQAGRFRLRGSLRGYLAICVANRARNANRRPRPVDPERLRATRTSQPVTNPAQIAARGNVEVLAVVPEEPENSVERATIGPDTQFAIDQVDWEKIVFA